MRIGDLIEREHVIVGLRVADKSQLLQQLARRAAAELHLDEPTILSALQTREDLGSTGLGKGFALPHARVDALSQFFALFVRLARPIDFAAIDGKPVDLVVLLLTPAGASNEHLTALAALSRPLRDEAFLQRVRSAANAETMHDLLANA